MNAILCVFKQPQVGERYGDFRPWLETMRFLKLCLLLKHCNKLKDNRYYEVHVHVQYIYYYVQLKFNVQVNNTRRTK